MEDIANMDIIGNPDVQSEYWDYQMWNDNCAVAAETSIIRQFGYDVNQGDMAYFSHANGWYQPGGGTSEAYVGNLIESFGIGTHTVPNASVADLAAELQAGHGVVIGVRSDQLWETNDPFQELIHFLAKMCGLDTSEYFPADHAITVTGISSDGKYVFVNDSGVPDGAANQYPIDKFMDAWENGNFTYIATNEPLPSLSQGNAMPDLDLSKWIPSGAAFATSFLTGSVALGVIAGSVVEGLMNDESFARMI